MVRPGNPVAWCHVVCVRECTVPQPILEHELWESRLLIRGHPWIHVRVAACAFAACIPILSTPHPTPKLGTGSLWEAVTQSRREVERDGTLPGDICRGPCYLPEPGGKGCGTCLNGTEVFNELFRSGGSQEHGTHTLISQAPCWEENIWSGHQNTSAYWLASKPL